MDSTSTAVIMTAEQSWIDNFLGKKEFLCLLAGLQAPLKFSYRNSPPLGKMKIKAEMALPFGY